MYRRYEPSLFALFAYALPGLQCLFFPIHIMNILSTQHLGDQSESRHSAKIAKVRSVLKDITMSGNHGAHYRTIRDKIIVCVANMNLPWPKSWCAQLLAREHDLCIIEEHRSGNCVTSFGGRRQQIFIQVIDFLLILRTRHHGNKPQS